MPKRMLRDGILTSELVNSLTPQAEVFYRRLMSVVDDFGRYDARVSVLRADLFKLQLERVRETDLPRWIAECEKAGLIRLYDVEGKPFLEMTKCDPPRAKSSKFPAPPPCAQAQTSARTCAQMRPDADADADAYSDSDSRTDARASPGALESVVRRLMVTHNLETTIAMNSPPWMHLVELVRSCGEPLVNLALSKACNGRNRLTGKRALDYATKICVEEKAMADSGSARRNGTGRKSDGAICLRKDG